MNFRKTATIAVVAGFVGGAFLLGGAVMSGGSGGASTSLVTSTKTPKATSTPFIIDDSWMAATATPVASSEGNAGNGGGVSLPTNQPSDGGQNNGGNGGGNPAPVQPQGPAPQPEQPAPQPPVVQPEPPLVVEHPAILKTTPVHNSAGNTRGTKIEFHFSHLMDKASVNAAFAMVSPVVNGTISWNPEGTVLTFDPAADFAYGEWVEAKIGASAKDAMGQSMLHDKSIKFRIMRTSTVDLLSVSAKDGHVYNPQVAALQYVNTSATRFNVGTWQRGFLTFDLSSLPEDLINITDTQLSVLQSAADATSYGGNTGNLRVQSVAFGSLDVSDFNKKGVELCWPVCAPVSYLLSSTQGLGVKSADIIAFVKADWEKRAELGYLSQYRLQFDKENNGDGPEISAEFHSGEGTTKPKLRITYTHP